MDEVIEVLVSMGIDPQEKYIRDVFQQVDLDGQLTLEISFVQVVILSADL